MLDIEEALFSSECTCTEINQKTWRYRLEGCIEEKRRERIAFVLSFDTRNATLRLITVFSKGEL